MGNERVRHEINPEFAEPVYLTAVEYQAKVDEAKEWQAEAHAEREFYDNDSFWFPGTGSTYFHGERG
jgi:hypothetical protein